MVSFFPSPTFFVSIHVPREGDDVSLAPAAASSREVSIHVPREGDDRRAQCPWPAQQGFQSTSPVRGTTSG